MFVFTHVLLCPGKGNLPDELDEIEVYGSEAQSGTQLATYSFEVRSFSVHIQFTKTPEKYNPFLKCYSVWQCYVM